jgi:hypothetical protein
VSRGPAPRQRTQPWVAGVLAFGTALLAWRLAAFVDRYAVDVLFWDQWDFLGGLFDGADLWTLFRWQHGPQRQGVAMWLIAALYDLSAWNGRADAFAAAGLMVLCAVCALWLVRRVAGPLRVWDLCVPLIFLGTQATETFVGTTNLAHGPVPAMLLVLYALALTLMDLRWRAAALVLLHFLAVNTGFTVLLAPITPVLLIAFALAPGRSTADRVLLGAGVLGCIGANLLFMQGFVFVTAVPCFQFPHPHPQAYVPFTGYVLSRPFGLIPGRGLRPVFAILTAGVLAAVALASTYRLLRSRGTAPAPTPIAAALIGFAMLFAFNSAVGRICLGMGAAGSTRYVPYVLPGLFAFYLLLRTSSRAWRTAALGVFLALCIGKELYTRASDEEAAMYAGYKNAWRACYLVRHDVQQCNAEAGYPIYPADFDRIRQRLDWLEARKLSLFRNR